MLHVFSSNPVKFAAQIPKATVIWGLRKYKVKFQCDVACYQKKVYIL